MLKSFTSILLLCVLTVSLALNGCSGGGSSTPAASPALPTSDPALTGAATADSLVSGTVTLKDSSVPVQARKATLSSDGTYTFITTGLVAPYILKAEWSDATGTNKMYSMATNQPGNVQMRSDSYSSTSYRTNINQFSDTAMYEASDGDPDYLFDNPDPSRYQTTAYNLDAVISSLSTVLAPLFALYNISGNPVSDANEDALRAMFNDVKFVVSSGIVTVTNRQTGSVIFSGPLNNLSSGTFNAANMPGGTGTGSNACTYTYSAWGTCDSTGNQTRTMTASSPAGCTGTPVLSQACTYVPPVTTCSSFTYSSWSACDSTGNQTRTMLTSSPSGCTGGSPVLSQACTYVPPACTYNYSVWGACDSTGNQTRTVTSSSPAGCTGTPVLSQACTYVPPVTTCSSFTYSAWGACQSNNTQTRTVTASSPSGCTGGTPVLSQACTYVPPVTTCTSFTYSTWGACQSNNTQTRTVTASSPSGCTGGTPVLSQACTYVPPVTTCTSFTYSTWGACQSNNTQTRTVTASSPSGCTGGTPVLSQACTYVPPAPTITNAQVTASCTACHGLTVNTTVFGSGGYTVTGRTAANWLSTINSMVSMGASLPAGATAQDLANYLATVP